MTAFLDPGRIGQARRRRGLTRSDLARLLGLTPRTITTYESDGAPLSAVECLTQALGFPPLFFEGPAAVTLDDAAVNFAAGRAAGARARHAAVAAAEFAVEVDQWISTRFRLPSLDVPTWPGEDPASAARILRTQWAQGTKPLPNMVQLVESKGVRVYVLPPAAAAVEAASFWHMDVPFILISRNRSPEETRHAIAHELGHLVLHQQVAGATEVREARVFADAFMLPSELLASLGTAPAPQAVLEAADRIKSEPVDVAQRLHAVGQVSDWHYRHLRVGLLACTGSMRAHERSRVLPQVLGSRTVNVRAIADDLHLPVAEIRSLTFGVELGVADPTSDAPRCSLASEPVSPRQLRVV